MNIKTDKKATKTLEDPSLDQIKKGLKTYFRIMEDWEISDTDAMILLGKPSRALFYKWKKSEVSSVPHDTVSRISYVLGIYKSLQILFLDTDRADRWVNRPNLAFGDRTAKEHMLSGEIVDIADVRHYLDTARGAW